MPTYVISFVCQKGGTAKTTSALNLAVEAVAHGLEVVVIDLDPQVSACDWKDIRGEAAPLVAATPVPHLSRTLKAAEDNGVDLVIIDTAGRTNDAASAAAKAADLVIIPLQPSLIDLKTIGATLDIIRLAGHKPTRALLTRVKAAGSRHEDTTAWLATQGVDVCPVMMGERVTYQDAYAQGLAVSEIEPNGKAAQEVLEVYKYISKILNLPTSRIVNNEEAGALASALRSSGATLPATANDPIAEERPITSVPAAQPSRRTTKAITVHFPEEVRRQLKALAGEEGRHVDDMVAEALNLLFAKYRKGEVAPRKANK